MRLKVLRWWPTAWPEDVMRLWLHNWNCEMPTVPSWIGYGIHVPRKSTTDYTDDTDQDRFDYLSLSVSSV